MGLTTSGLPKESSRGKAGALPKEVSNEDPNISSELRVKGLLEDVVAEEEEVEDEVGGREAEGKGEEEEGVEEGEDSKGEPK